MFPTMVKPREIAMFAQGNGVFHLVHDAIAYRMERESEEGSEWNSNITLPANTLDFHQEGGCSRCVHHKMFMT